MFVSRGLEARWRPEAGARLPAGPTVVAYRLTLAVEVNGEVHTGSGAVVQGENRPWSRGFGFADLASPTPAGADTIYAIGSITKLFTATMLMQLRDARLDELISKMRAAPTLPARHG